MEKLKHTKTHKYLYSENEKNFGFISLEMFVITSAVSLKSLARKRIAFRFCLF